MHSQKNRYGVKRPVKHRRKVLNPTERSDIGWAMLKAWKNTPKDQRPSWETHKANSWKAKRLASEVWNA